MDNMRRTNKGWIPRAWPPGMRKPDTDTRPFQKRTAFQQADSFHRQNIGRAVAG